MTNYTTNDNELAIDYRGMSGTIDFHRSRVIGLCEACEEIESLAFANECGEHERVCGLLNWRSVRTLQHAYGILIDVINEMMHEIDELEGATIAADDDAATRSKEWHEHAVLDMGMAD